MTRRRGHTSHSAAGEYLGGDWTSAGSNGSDGAAFPQPPAGAAPGPYQNSGAAPQPPPWWQYYYGGPPPLPHPPMQAGGVVPPAGYPYQIEPESVEQYWLNYALQQSATEYARQQASQQQVASSSGPSGARHSLPGNRLIGDVSNKGQAEAPGACFLYKQPELSRSSQTLASAAAAPDQGKQRRSSGKPTNAAAGASVSSTSQPSSSQIAAAASSGSRISQQLQQEDPAAQLASIRRCRYDALFHEVLYRELMLKTSPLHWTSVPRLKSITLSISAAQDTRIEGKANVDREDLLLYQLALEMVALRPATFVYGRSSQMGKAEGVQVVLDGEPMLDFLEKLVYMILPNQIGFEGTGPFQLVPPSQSSRRVKQTKLYSSELKVSNLLLYPDFEPLFELFEPLQSMQVRFVVEGAPSPEVATMLLSGYAMPVQAKAPDTGGEAEAA